MKLALNWRERRARLVLISRILRAMSEDEIDTVEAGRKLRALDESLGWRR